MNSTCNPKGSLIREKLEQQTINSIVERIKKEFSDLQHLKFDVEFTLFMCRLIEDEVQPCKNKAKKTDKLALLFKVFDKLYPNQLKEDDKKLISKTVDYFLESGAIKKTSLAKKILKLGVKYLKKSLLL